MAKSKSRCSRGSRKCNASCVVKKEYQKIMMECGIADFKHKGLLLEITFTDGSTYEYFGVNANVYKKLINSDKQVRFAKRFIYESFLYRKSKKAIEEGNKE